MNTFQKFITSIVSRETAAAMEAESRQWMVRCSCGHATSIWDIGGIRYKGGGKPRRLMRCPKCGERSWHVIEKSV